MRILFFGRLSDELGRREMHVDVDASSINALLLHVCETLGRDAAASLYCDDVSVAVDQTLQADRDAAVLAGAKEVAFFPPVTGG